MKVRLYACTCLGSSRGGGDVGSLPLARAERSRRVPTRPLSALRSVPRIYVEERAKSRQGERRLKCGSFINYSGMSSPLEVAIGSSCLLPNPLRGGPEVKLVARRHVIDRSRVRRAQKQSWGGGTTQRSESTVEHASQSGESLRIKMLG